MTSCDWVPRWREHHSREYVDTYGTTFTVCTGPLMACDVTGSPVGRVLVSKIRLVTPIVVFIAFLEQARREQQFWCVNCKKIPNIEGENKYLDFVSYHLARAEKGWRKNSQATKWIQVATILLLTIDACGQALSPPHAPLLIWYNTYIRYHNISYGTYHIFF